MCDSCKWETATLIVQYVAGWDEGEWLQYLPFTLIEMKTPTLQLLDTLQTYNLNGGFLNFPFPVCSGDTFYIMELKLPWKLVIFLWRLLGHWAALKVPSSHHWWSCKWTHFSVSSALFLSPYFPPPGISWHLYLFLLKHYNYVSAAKCQNNVFRSSHSWH